MRVPKYFSCVKIFKLVIVLLAFAECGGLQQTWTTNTDINNNTKDCYHNNNNNNNNNNNTIHITDEDPQFAIWVQQKYVQKYDMQKAQQLVGRIFDQGWNLKWNNLCKSYQDETNEISLDNMFHFLSIDFEHVSLVSIFTLILGSGICFPLVHNYFSNKVSRKDRKFSEDEKLIMTFHTMFASLFGLQLIPYTILMVLFLFGNPVLLYLKYRYFFIGTAISHALMNAWELVFRSIIKFDLFTVVHHHIYNFCMVMIFLKVDIFVHQHIAILDWMNTFNFILYAANVFFKVFRGQRPILVQRVILSGLILLTITRTFQTVLVVKHLTCTDANKDITYWILTITTSLVTLLQTYTWIPYTLMYKKAGSITINSNSTCTNNNTNNSNSTCTNNNTNNSTVYQSKKNGEQIERNNGVLGLPIESPSKQALVKKTHHKIFNIFTVFIRKTLVEIDVSKHQKEN